MATDPFDAAARVDSSLGYNDAAATAAVNARQSSNPDLAGRANRIGRQFELPGDTVERNIDWFDATMRANRTREIAESNPPVGNWLTNFRNAAVASDDIENIDRVAAAYQIFNRTAYGAFQSVIGAQQDPLTQASSENRLTPRSLLGEAGRDALAIANGPGVSRVALALQNRAREQVVAAMRSNVQAQAADAADIESRQERGVAGQIGGTLLAGLDSLLIEAPNAAFQIALDPLGDLENVLFGDANALGFDAARDAVSSSRQTSSQRQGEMVGRSDNFIADNLYQGLRSTPMSLAALATRNPAMAAGLFGGVTGATSFGEARDAGLPYERALSYGLQQGTIEAAFEVMPMSILLGRINDGTNFGSALGRFMVTEIGGEQLTTIGQDASRWAMIEGNEGKTFQQYLDERPSAAAATFFATLSGGGPQVLAAEGLRRYQQRAISQVVETEQAVQENVSLDEVMVAAAEAMTRTRDPEAFRALLAEVGEDGGGANIYVPAEVLAQYNQDNPDDASFNQYAEQIREGVATGGEVVIPIADAATLLAGTPAWESIRGDVRPSPGSMSPNEIEAGNAEIEAALDAQNTAQDAEDRRQARIDGPREQLQSGMRDALLNAGYTPDVANLYANLLVQREATRAERSGRELTGNEFANLGIRQVLPEGLGQVVAAGAGDASGGLGPVIDTMRRPAKGSENRRSLLDFIAERGGVEDTGGDLADMGLGDWHRERPGRRRLIKERAGGLSRLMGRAGNDNTQDAIAMAAWEAGYFPEFDERPDVNDLQEAISRELAGEPVYADETQDEGLQQAADELYALLDQRGIDPETATDAEIAAVVEEYQAEQSQEAGYEQANLPEEIDGKPTRNSEGRFLAQTEEGIRNFYAWFKDSKVVDEQGRPLVVYHGTTAEFDAFDDSKTGANDRGLWGRGHYFSTNVAAPNSYALRQGDGARIIPAYVSIEAPLLLKTDSDLTIRLPNGTNYRDMVGPNLDGSKIKEAAQDEGLDGVIQIKPDGQIGDLVAFQSTKIKSAIGNNGNFDPADARILYQAAYHGSPHIFDKFSLDAIGTGEGAQAYGWGLYFAGKKEIAEFYRESISPRQEIYKLGDRVIYRKRAGAGTPLPNETPVEDMAGYFIGQYGEEQAVGVALNFQDRTQNPELEKYWGEVAARVPEVAPHFSKKIERKGRLYEVDIPEDSEYLLWDAPLSEQPESVKNGIARIKGEGKEIEDLTDDELVAALGGYEKTLDGSEKKGAGFYKEMSATMGDSAASKTLHEAGIAGIKYLDGGSRTAGDGTYNYVVFDDSAVSIRAYEQTFGDGPRGRILFTDAGATIELFEQRNLSTFLHESGHLWLEQLKADAAAPDATDQIKADYQTVLDWFAKEGHDVSGGIPVEAHEMWARGIERYFMEGKAPTVGLAKAFEAFRSWLLTIYRTVKALNAPISPEIREVMDRMIATDVEIEEAIKEQAIELAFNTAEAVNMTEAEYAAYVDLANAAKQEGHDILLRKVTYAVRQKRTKEYREIEARERKDVTEAVDARPMFRALAMLRAKGADKLSRAWLTENYGADILGQLPGGNPVYSDEGSANADMVAEQAGLTSGDELVKMLAGMEKARRDLKASGDKRSLRQYTIDTETDALMKDRYGDPLGDGSIEREARAAVHNDKQGEVLAYELRMLGRTTKRVPTPYATARRWAERRVREGTVNDMVSRSAIQRYTRTAAKHGREAEKAILAGDMETAFGAKQKQMLQNALAGEARKVSDDVDVAVRRLGKLAKQRTVKSISQDYLDQIHGLLERFDFRQRSQSQIDRMDSFAKWAAARQAEGHDVVIPPETAKHWSRMSVEELLGLDATVKQIRHLGRLKQSLIDNKVKREFEAVVDEALDAIGQLPPKKPKGSFTEPGYWDSLKSNIASIDAMLLKMETVFDWLDKKQFGVFNRTVFKPLVDAQANEFNMMNDVTGRLIQRMRDVPKQTIRRWFDKVTIPELIDPATGTQAVFDREKLVVMAMNMGNESSAMKLVGGYDWHKQYGSIEAAEAVVMDVLNRELTADDWLYVQDVWDIINELWPQISELEKRVNGIAPDKVEARPLETSAGTLQGGYFPVVYDPSSRVGQKNSEEEAKGLFPSNYTRSTTVAGSTKERTNFVGPIHLSIGVINRHVAEVIHDITHREAVMQADKILSEPRIQQAVADTLGPEIAEQFRPWLQHIANEWVADREANSWAERFLKGLRLKASFVGLAWRWTTASLQIAGYSNSTEIIGAKWVAHGVRRAAQHPVKTWDFIAARSQEVQQRMSTLDRDIRDSARKFASRSKTGVLDPVVQFGFHGIGYMDRIVSTGTWIGAYDKMIAQGKSETEAIYFADKAIRQSQGSNAAKDMARVQRGTGKMGEALKLTTMFYSYVSAFYQRQRTLGRDVRDATVERDMAEFPALLARAWWLLVVPAVAAELLAGRWPDDDEDPVLWAAQQMLVSSVGAVPIMREIANGLESGFGYNFTPASGFGEAIVASSKDTLKLVRGEETTRATRNTFDLVGYATGRVPGQAGQTAQFLVDTMSGDADPDSFGDWYTGLTKGRIRD